MRNKKSRNIEFKVLLEEWTESERGWGTREDGASIHQDRENHDKYIRSYWAGMPKTVPNEYSFPGGEPIEIFVDKKTFDEVQKHGSVRLGEGSYLERRKKWQREV